MLLSAPEVTAAASAASLVHLAVFPPPLRLVAGNHYPYHFVGVVLELVAQAEGLLHGELSRLSGARVSIVAYPFAVDVIVPWFFPLARAFTICVLSLRHSVDSGEEESSSSHNLSREIHNLKDGGS